MIGKTLSHFRIVEKIGEGGMGVVYRAEDQKLHRHVALKVLPPELVGDEERRMRFIREARLAAAVTHPNIAAIHQIDEADDTVFIAMELVEGETLDKRIAGKPMPTRTALKVAVQIGEGLARAHGAGIVHRDLKPENVIVNSGDHAKILDFGLAKLFESEDKPDAGSSRLRTISADITREGHIAGTAAYMSPEQARGLNLDPRSDLFSFGAVLYKMFTGQVPFGGQTVTDILSGILRDEPAPVAGCNPEAPAEIERIIRKCLQKEPGDRYQHADEVVVDLRNLRRVSDSQSLPRVSASTITSAPALAEPARRGWLRPAAIGAAVVLAGAVLLTTLPGLLGERSPAPPVVAAENALAVLPLSNLKDAADPQRLGQILQELIITDLSGLEELKVFSSQRLFDIRKQLGGNEDTIDREIATELARRAGARTMLTGTLSQLGPKWIVTTQLVQVADGAVLKSERIDGEDLYSMVDELTGRLRSNLGLTDVTGTTVEMAVKDKTTGSIDAYQHYLAGVEFLNDTDYEAAVAELQKAVDMDPDFGQARVKLAMATWWFNPDQAWWVTSDTTPPEQILDELLASDVKLSRRDRLEAEALRPLVAQRYADAKPLYARLVKEFPDDKEILYGYGEALFHSSTATRLEALDAFEKAVQLDPSFHLAFGHMLNVYNTKQLYDRGVATLGKILEQNPAQPAWWGDWTRLVIYQGDAPAIDAAVRRAVDQVRDPVHRRDLMMTLGDAFGDVGQFDRREEFLQKALAVETAEDQDEVLLALARHYGSVHRYDEQRRMLDEAAEVNPMNPALLQTRGNFLAQRREFRTFAAQARRGLAEHPQAFPYAMGWYIASLAIDDPAEISAARAAIEPFLEGDAPRKSTHIAAAGMLREAGDFAGAGRELEQALAIAPDDRLALLNKAQLLLAERRYDEVAETLAAGAEVTQDRQGIDSFEVLLLMARRRYDDALTRLAELREKAPDDLNWRVQSIRALILDGRADEADALLEDTLPRLLSDFDRRNWLAVAGLTHASAGEFDQAASRLRQALALRPDVPSPRDMSWLAAVEMVRGRTGEAADLLDSALQIRPFAGDLLRLRAALDLMEDDAGRAVQTLTRMIEEAPRDRGARTLLALALAEKERFAEAEEQARRSVELASLRETRAVLAWVLVASGRDLDAGMAEARRALEMPDDPFGGELRFPYFPPPEHSLGLAYLKKGDFERARAQLEAAARKRPGRALIREHLDLAVSRKASASP